MLLPCNLETVMFKNIEVLCINTRCCSHSTTNNTLKFPTYLLNAKRSVDEDRQALLWGEQQRQVQGCGKQTNRQAPAFPSRAGRAGHGSAATMCRGCLNALGACHQRKHNLTQALLTSPGTGGDQIPKAAGQRVAHTKAFLPR